MTDVPEPPKADHRITVNLNPKASEDLYELRSSTGTSITEIIARALSVYRFINSEAVNGSNLILRRKEQDTVGNAYVATEMEIRFL